MNPIKNDQSKASNAIIGGYLFCGVAYLNWALGHSWAVYMDGSEKNHYFYETRGSSLMIVQESFVGLFPTAAILVAGKVAAHCLEYIFGK